MISKHETAGTPLRAGLSGESLPFAYPADDGGPVAGHPAEGAPHGDDAGVGVSGRRILLVLGGGRRGRSGGRGASRRCGAFFGGRRGTAH